jgi:hypothetical protein
LSRILYLATQIPLAVQCSAMTFDLPPKMYKPAKTKTSFSCKLKKSFSLKNIHLLFA